VPEQLQYSFHLRQAEEPLSPMRCPVASVPLSLVEVDVSTYYSLSDNPINRTAKNKDSEESKQLTR
jgi:hypothetical protein